VEALQDTKDVYARLKALDPALAKRLKNDCKVIYEELKDVVPGEPAFFVPWL